MYTLCTQENRLNYLFKNINLTVDQRTENPRVGGSILSRPTTSIYLKLGFIICKIFASPPLNREDRKEILISEPH